MPVLESSLCRAHYTLAYSDVVRCYCCARCLSPVIAVEALRHLAYLSVQYEPGSTWSRRKDQASYLPTYLLSHAILSRSHRAERGGARYVGAPVAKTVGL